MPSLEALMPTMENDLADALTRLSTMSPAARAAVLLGPLEQAAATAATAAQAHDAFVSVVRDVYAPAIREAHRRSGRSVVDLLDELARILLAGRVVRGALGQPVFVQGRGAAGALQDFLAGLVSELTQTPQGRLEYVAPYL